MVSPAPLDKIRKYITRFHNTNSAGFKGILESGAVKPSKDFSGDEAVFTTANPVAWSNHRRPINLEIQIPKDWYKNHSSKNSRMADTDIPYERHQTELTWEGEPWDRIVDEKWSEPVSKGGRTSTFDEAIPVDWIKKVCWDKGTSNEKCLDGASLDLYKKYWRQ